MRVYVDILTGVFVAEVAMRSDKRLRKEANRLTTDAAEANERANQNWPTASGFAQNRATKMPQS